jgi:hypothetical protein
MSGVPVYVGTDKALAVAEGGNQTIVCVAVGASDSGGVSVANVETVGRQAARNNVIARSGAMRATPTGKRARGKQSPIK